MIDLHTHTAFSDGTFTPQQLMRLAAERGLSTIAVTDHDTTEGWADAGTSADAAGIELVTGVEFSASYEGSSVHVLAYWPDAGDTGFAEELTRLHDDRFRRGELMVEKLRSLGYPITFERVREISQSDNIVRPHIAQALVEAGVVATVKEAFTEELIADGGKADVQKHALHPMDALKLIKRADGVCVLAHPGMWGAQGELPIELIEEMTASGMDGLEVDHPDHDEEQRDRFRALAHRLELLVTGSSDCHGTRYDPIRLGCATTAEDQFAELKARAKR